MNISFMNDWSDGKRWFMGILAALIIATLISLGKPLADYFFGSNSDIPGGTGWIFGGYYNLQSLQFTEGPYFTVPSSNRLDSDEMVNKGDYIFLNVSRPVVIVDYVNKGQSGWETSPITVGKITSSHLTGVTLPAKTELVVRDIKEGHYPGNQNVALWLRVVLKPK